MMPFQQTALLFLYVDCCSIINYMDVANHYRLFTWVDLITGVCYTPIVDYYHMGTVDQYVVTTQAQLILTLMGMVV